MAGAIFIFGMIGMLSTMLGWLLVGGMHASAHPKGETPQFHLLIEGWNFKPDKYYAGPLPRAFLMVGRMREYSTISWGFRLAWDFNPAAGPHELSWRRSVSWAIHWRAPVLRIARGW